MTTTAPLRPAAETDPFRITRLLPGILFATAVGVIALGVAAVEARAFGHPVIEGLVVAILLGMLVRTLWTPPTAVNPGVSFTAKEILEVAVLLLGASVDLPLLLRAGPSLAVGIVLLVVLGIVFSYGIGRALGLPHKLSVLVACGNSICGNSAIAAIAPVIRAEKAHVASSIAFTAILGVVVVIGLPFLIHPLGLSFYQYGVLAGLTVYAVPQVLAAAFPVSVLSGQVGTLVKLVRVLMLGPVCVVLSIIVHRAGQRAGGTAKLGFSKMVPWFIIGFLGMLVMRSLGVIPEILLDPVKLVAGALTTIAMAALGLGVDLRVVARAGGRVTAAVTCSLVMLAVISVTLIRILGVA